MSDEKLLEEANKARQIAAILSESIYKYLGGVITSEELKIITNKMLSESRIKLLEHKYIIKDLCIPGFEDLSSSRDDLNDVEELNITD